MYNEKALLEKEGYLLILSSPSGGGKTTIYKELLKRNSDLTYSVSVTTRKRRQNEVDGKDYIFVDEDRFQELIEDEAFAEWAIVHGNLYGTLKKSITEALKSHKILLFDIDVQGAARLKEAYADSAVMIFILPPSYEALKNRLYSRQTESDDDLRLRLQNALWEYDRIRHYDYIAINDKIDDCVADIEMIIRTESLKLNRIKNIKWKGDTHNE